MFIKRGSLTVLLAVVLSGALPGRASAAQIGTLAQLSPVPTSYVLGLGADFLPFVLSGLGDVTALVQAVDLTLPPGAISTSTSGCDAADFAGFVAGRIALMQRGTCTFSLKTANAAAAGAVGALIFNEGQPGRTDTISGTLSVLGSIPSAFLSFGLGSDLASLAAQGLVMRLQVTDNSAPPVPEPAALLLLSGGLALCAARRSRRV